MKNEGTSHLERSEERPLCDPGSEILLGGIGKVRQGKLMGCKKRMQRLQETYTEYLRSAAATEYGVCSACHDEFAVLKNKRQIEHVQLVHISYLV